MTEMGTPQTAEEAETAIAPTLRKVTEDIYEQLLNSVEDYLKSNAVWNIGSEIQRCRAIERENQKLRFLNRELIDAAQGCLGILASAESNASGRPEWDYVGWRVAAFRAAITGAVYND